MRYCGKIFIFLTLICTNSQTSAYIKTRTKSSATLHESLLVPANKWKELDCECGVAQEVGSRKINNLTIKRGELPWLVSITAVKKNQSFRDRVHLCSGSLINFLYVVTSAGCVNGLPKNNLRIELIGFHVNSSKLVKVQSVKFHPLFRNGQDNGIALLKLASYVKPMTKAVPLCLPAALNRNNESLGMAMNPAKDTSIQFRDVLIKRWVYRKSQDTDFPSMPVYAQVQVNVIEAENCSKLYPDVLKSKTLCIKPEDPNSAISKYKEDFFCYIEPGIPLMRVVHQTRSGERKRAHDKHYLTGLSSIESGCSDIGNTTVHTNNVYNIEGYESWIRSNSFDGKFCKH